MTKAKRHTEMENKQQQTAENSQKQATKKQWVEPKMESLEVKNGGTTTAPGDGGSYDS